MNRTFAVIIGVCLALIGLSAGGCSLIFFPYIITDPGGNGMFTLIWLSGLLIGALCLWGAYGLLRTPKPKPPGPKPPEP